MKVSFGINVERNFVNDNMDSVNKKCSTEELKKKANEQRERLNNW